MDIDANGQGVGTKQRLHQLIRQRAPSSSEPPSWAILARLRVWFSGVKGSTFEMLSCSVASKSGLVGLSGLPLLSRLMERIRAIAKPLMEPPEQPDHHRDDAQPARRNDEPEQEHQPRRVILFHFHAPLSLHGVGFLLTLPHVLADPHRLTSAPLP